MICYKYKNIVGNNLNLERKDFGGFNNDVHASERKFQFNIHFCTSSSNVTSHTSRL